MEEDALKQQIADYAVTTRLRLADKNAEANNKMTHAFMRFLVFARLRVQLAVKINSFHEDNRLEIFKRGNVRGRAIWINIQGYNDTKDEDLDKCMVCSGVGGVLTRCQQCKQPVHHACSHSQFDQAIVCMGCGDRELTAHKQKICAMAKTAAQKARLSASSANINASIAAAAARQAATSALDAAVAVCAAMRAQLDVDVETTEEVAKAVASSGEAKEGVAKAVASSVEVAKDGEANAGVANAKEASEEVVKGVQATEGEAKAVAASVVESTEGVEREGEDKAEAEVAKEVEAKAGEAMNELAKGGEANDVEAKAVAAQEEEAKEGESTEEFNKEGEANAEVAMGGGCKEDAFLDYAESTMDDLKQAERNATEATSAGDKAATEAVAAKVATSKAAKPADFNNVAHPPGLPPEAHVQSKSAAQLQREMEERKERLEGARAELATLKDCWRGLQVDQCCFRCGSSGSNKKLRVHVNKCKKLVCYKCGRKYNNGTASHACAVCFPTHLQETPYEKRKRAKKKVETCELEYTSAVEALERKEYAERQARMAMNDNGEGVTEEREAKAEEADGAKEERGAKAKETNGSTWGSTSGLPPRDRWRPARTRLTTEEAKRREDNGQGVAKGMIDLTDTDREDETVVNDKQDDMSDSSSRRGDSDSPMNDTEGEEETVVNDKEEGEGKGEEELPCLSFMLDEVQLLMTEEEDKEQRAQEKMAKEEEAKEDKRDSSISGESDSPKTNTTGVDFRCVRTGIGLGGAADVPNYHTAFDRATMPEILVCPAATMERLKTTMAQMWLDTKARYDHGKSSRKGGEFWTVKKLAGVEWSQISKRNIISMKNLVGVLNKMLTSGGDLFNFLPPEVRGWNVGAVSLLESKPCEGEYHADMPEAGDAFLFISMTQKEPYTLYMAEKGTDKECAIEIPHSASMYVMHGLCHTRLMHRNKSKQMKIGLRVGLFRPRVAMHDMTDRSGHIATATTLYATATKYPRQSQGLEEVHPLREKCKRFTQAHKHTHTHTHTHAYTQTQTHPPGYTNTKPTLTHEHSHTCAHKHTNIHTHTHIHTHIHTHTRSQTHTKTNKRTPPAATEAPPAWAVATLRRIRRHGVLQIRKWTTPPQPPG